MSGRVFVTGGSRGIGRAVSRALAARGADVAIGYRERTPEAEATAEAVRAHGRRAVLVRGDVAEAVETLVERAAVELGGLDGFVSCAVLPLPLPITDLGREELERTLRANAGPFVLGAIAAARHMEGGGRIVALSATGAHATPATPHWGWPRARSRPPPASWPSRWPPRGSRSTPWRPDPPTPRPSTPWPPTQRRCASAWPA